MTGTTNTTDLPLPRHSTALIGYTGFVGSNLAAQAPFDVCYNSANIHQIEGREFDLLVCAGVSAVKWWANQNAEADQASINKLTDRLVSVKSRETIVLSTVDVYPKPWNVDESTALTGLPNHPYGTNRLSFESRMQEIFPNTRVVRLPGLFGPGLKKNVIFDLIHGNRVDQIHPASAFQYYGLDRLWHHLTLIRRADLRLVNLATEPVVTSEIVERYFPGRTLGDSAVPLVRYDVRTRYSDLLGGAGDYVESGQAVLQRLGVYFSQVGAPQLP